MNTDAKTIIFEDDCTQDTLGFREISPMREMTDDEKIDFVAARILEKYKPAFMELAK